MKLERDTMAELILAGVRADVPALRRFGVHLRPPWWRRQLQARIAPSHYRRWVQRATFDQLRDGGML